ncbi:hypothetical protein DFH09DRAFT_653247 [Mycena vulgaris]|nr:hypothetical protein DFH09DRAFT_653247 [Mycena vulgaris]
MKEVIPFPTHAHGFLYYYSGPNAGPLEGGVRLRCTSDSSSSSFVRGQDLLGPSRLPWQISLPQVACRATYASLANQLVHENLVTQEQLSRCKSIFSHRDSISPYSTLFHLDSTFLVNFSRKVVLTVVGKALHPLNLTNLFTQYRKRVVICPWTGIGCCALRGLYASPACWTSSASPSNRENSPACRMLCGGIRRAGGATGGRSFIHGALPWSATGALGLRHRPQVRRCCCPPSSVGQYADSLEIFLLSS